MENTIMLIGHGVDLVDIAALRSLIDVEGSDLIERCFTLKERSSFGDGPNRFDRIAGRFAAKEAVMKALGTGFSKGVAFKDIEILTRPSGALEVKLHGQVSEVAQALKVSRWLLSTTHDAGVAIGSAIAVSD